MGQAVTDEDKLKLHKQLCEDMGSLLGGHPPEVQSTVLAEMLATWLGGWPESLRNSLLVNHMEQVTKLIPLVESNLDHIAEITGKKH